MTTIEFLDRGDFRNYITRREVRLSGIIPKRIEKAGLKLVETERARITAMEQIEAAKAALVEAKDAADRADVDEAHASPEELLKRLESAEETPTREAAKAAKKALKRAENAHVALLAATKIAYVELIAVVDKERQVWVAQARIEGEKALFEVASLTRRVEEAATKLNDATGVLSMFEGMDQTRAGDDQWKLPLMALAGGPQSPNLSQATAALHQATGRASAYIREALTNVEA